MSDLDCVLFIEYGYANKLPLALVEVAQDIGQEKPTGVIPELAKMSNLRSWPYMPPHRALIQLAPRGTTSTSSA
jgi:hypothetical protein